MKLLVEQQKQGRRDFLRSTVRYSLLGGALILARMLSLRQVGSSASCSQPGVCKSCAVFHKCNEPKAATARNAAS